MQLGRLSVAGALVLSLSATLSAQAVRGAVVSVGGAPVPGVMVALLDSASRTVGSALTDANGAYLVKAPAPGTYRLRTLRIGFRSSLSLPFSLAAGQELARRLDVNEIRFLLDTIRITGRNSCRLNSDSVSTTYAVWEQVRTALEAIQFTARDKQIVSTILAYQRRLDRASNRVQEQTASANTALVTEPWHSRQPRILHDSGYVLDDGEVSTFFAPGIDALLSQHFVEDHCFRFVEAADSTQLAIRFEPSPDRKSTSEIAGQVYLDRASSELRWMMFGYTNSPRPQLNEGFGSLEFTRMKDDRWAIARWYIRMPVLLLGASSAREARIAEFRENGGEMALALRGTDTLFKRDPLRIAGVVVDSLTGASIPQARITLAGTDVHALSDAAGRFKLEDVIPGAYTLEVRTPSLDSVSAVSQTMVTIARATDEVRIRVPTGQQIAASLCGTSTLSGIGIVVGNVFLRGDTTMPETHVTAEWQQVYVKASAGVVEKGTRSKWAEGRVDSRGRFRVCGVAVNTKLTLRAESDSATALDTVTIPPGGRMARANLTLDRQAVRGGLFSGTVVADSSLTPLPDAEILIPAANRRVTSNERGAFRMADVPVGPQKVEVRRKGYTLASSEVTFSPNQMQQRKFVMVPGKLEEPAGSEKELIASFEENRKAGRGHFLTAEDLAKLGSRRMSEVLSRIPGASVVRGRSNAGFAGARAPGGRAPNPGQRNDVGSGLYCPDDLEQRSGIECGCYSQVFVNNMLMNRGTPAPPFDVNTIQTEHVEALEYYRNAAEAPSRYNGAGATCGVLVLWTKTARPDPKRP